MSSIYQPWNSPDPGSRWFTWISHSHGLLISHSPLHYRFLSSSTHFPYQLSPLNGKTPDTTYKETIASRDPQPWCRWPVCLQAAWRAMELYIQSSRQIEGKQQAATRSFEKPSKKTSKWYKSMVKVQFKRKTPPNRARSQRTRNEPRNRTWRRIPLTRACNILATQVASVHGTCLWLVTCFSSPAQRTRVTITFRLNTHYVVIKQVAAGKHYFFWTNYLCQRSTHIVPVGRRKKGRVACAGPSCTELASWIQNGT